MGGLCGSKWGASLVAPPLLASAAVCWGYMSPDMSCAGPQLVVPWMGSLSVLSACGCEELQKNMLSLLPFPGKPLLDLLSEDNYVANQDLLNK